nr:hypothetical protein [Alteromonas macleodii]
MKVAELLEIVASQECVFEGRTRLTLLRDKALVNKVELYAAGCRLGIFRGYGLESRINLATLRARLNSCNPQTTITSTHKTFPRFKIGFLDYEEGWVETVTSEELGLSEEPQ